MKEFKEFINEKIAVVFDNKKEIDKFYELCLKNGKINETIINKKDDVLKSYVYFSKEYQMPLVSYGGGDDRLKVKASEFLASTPTIEIFQSKQTVVCLKKQDNKVVAVGKARCNPDDEFDFDYGAKLAFERMEMDIVRRNIVNAGECLARGLKEGMQNVSDTLSGIKTLKNGMRIKKQDKYEVGDRVLIKKEWKSYYKKSLSGPNAITLLNSVRKITGASGEAYLVPTDKDRSFYILGKDIKGKVL